MAQLVKNLPIVLPQVEEMGSALGCPFPVLTLSTLAAAAAAAKSLQLCPTLCDPMDYSPPGISVHKILQARILEWIPMPSSRDFLEGSNPCVLHHRQILYQLSHKGSPRTLEWVAYPFSRGSF